jgi:hypothetical protein
VRKSCCSAGNEPSPDDDKAGCEPSHLIKSPRISKSGNITLESSFSDHHKEIDPAGLAHADS